jgi:hypothetical protein
LKTTALPGVELLACELLPEEPVPEEPLVDEPVPEEPLFEEPPLAEVPCLPWRRGSIAASSQGISWAMRLTMDRVTTVSSMISLLERAWE